MTIELFTAELTVPKRGFKWCDAGMVKLDADVDVNVHEGTTQFHPYVDLIRGRYLVPKGRGDIATRKFDPFGEHTGMFHEFSNLPESEDAILKFANRYGWLGMAETVVQESELPEDQLSNDELFALADDWPPKPHSAFSGERIEAWTSEISQINEAVSLWDRLVAENRKTNVQGFPQSRTDETIAEDWHRLEVTVNYGLGNTGGAVLSYDGKQVGFRFRYHAVTLGKVLWLQLARAIVGNKQYERCKQCATYFEIGSGAARKSRVYCSETCRAAAYRKRKAEQT